VSGFKTHKLNPPVNRINVKSGWSDAKELSLLYGIGLDKAVAAVGAIRAL
jgi:hypothetical protein